MIHLLAFQEALREEGLALTQEDYDAPSLGMDERNCTPALLEATVGWCEQARVSAILFRKATLFSAMTVHVTPPLFPGVVEFVKAGSGL